jgi:hypothetical protein
MQPQILPGTGISLDQQGDTSPAIVVLSSSLVVLYANRDGTAVLRELKDTEEASLRVPAPVLAYLANGILERIDIRRMVRVYAPFSMTCSIQGPARIWYCQAFGLPSPNETNRSRIVFLFSDKPPRVGSTEQRAIVSTSSSSLLLLDAPVPETQVI